MDASQLILSLIKDQKIKENVNPLIYYSIKLIYNSDFSKRSRYFGRAIKLLFDELGSNMNLQLNAEEINMENTMTFDMNFNFDSEQNDINIDKGTSTNLNSNTNNNNDNDNLNITVNKGSYTAVNGLMKCDWHWCFNHLVEYDNEYILDKDEDYILLKLIKNFIFSSEPAKSSPLMLCYNIFVSSIELLFCFRLVMNFPKYYFQKREEKNMAKYFSAISNRIQHFYSEWSSIYRYKYEHNKLFQEMIGNQSKAIEIEKPLVDLMQFTMSEPILNSKYISFTKLIKEGPFCFEIEEVARQICIIDHEMLSSLNKTDFSQFVVKKETPKSFDKFFIREKQLQCYILYFIAMHNNLENKKNMIQNFISLAHTLKQLNNQQTCNTIINAFSIAEVTKKNLLWKLIEKKYRDIYTNLEKELNDIELTDNSQLRDKREEAVVPHIKFIITMINNFVIKLKDTSEDKKDSICSEYQQFIVLMNEYSKNRYLFFKMNPLYDFFNFGFLEIFKSKRWKLKMKFDLSNYTQKLDQLDKLLNFLNNNFHKM